MKKGKKEQHFIKKASYEGGMEAMRKFIGSNMVYPEQALSNNIEGVVTVKFTVNHKGKVIKAKAIHKLGYGCDEEALRLVRLLNYKIPKNKGLKVLFHKDLNIHFRLPKPSSIESAMNIKYEYTQEAPTQKEKKGTPNNGYNYTINL